MSWRSHEFCLFSVANVGEGIALCILLCWQVSGSGRGILLYVVQCFICSFLNVQLPFSGLSLWFDTCWMRACLEGARGWYPSGLWMAAKPKALVQHQCSWPRPVVLQSAPSFGCLRANCTVKSHMHCKCFLVYFGIQSTYAQETCFLTCVVKQFLKRKIRISPICCCCCR